MRSSTLLFLALLAAPLAHQPVLAETAAAQAAPAATTEQAPAVEAPRSMEQQLQGAGIAFTKGPTVAKLGSVAELKVPENYLFIGAGPEGIERYMQATQNMTNGDEVGVLLAPSGWTLYFDYKDTGHVKDDEKDKLDAGALMESMVEGQEAANEERSKRGWSVMKMQGWATEPHYDTKTNNLKWAFKLSSSEDEHKSFWINENIRLLGRTGVIEATLVSGVDNFAACEQESDALLASSFNFVSGHKYSEFKEGDKLATYGLAALVLGGGAAVAAKTGLLAKLWKPIAIGLVACGAAISRFFKKLSGKQVD